MRRACKRNEALILVDSQCEGQWYHLEHVLSCLSYPTNTLHCIWNTGSNINCGIDRCKLLGSGKAWFQTLPALGLWSCQTSTDCPWYRCTSRQTVEHVIQSLTCKPNESKWIPKSKLWHQLWTTYRKLLQLSTTHTDSIRVFASENSQL